MCNVRSDTSVSILTLASALNSHTRVCLLWLFEVVCDSLYEVCDSVRRWDKV